MLANCFPESLSVGLINAVHKSGDNFDMSNHRGITVGSVFAQLFAMILEQRLSAWAKSHTVKAKGQAGFRKDYRTTNNIFIPTLLIDKQKQARQNGMAGNFTAILFISTRHLTLCLGTCYKKCWRKWESMDVSWTL